MITAHTDVVGSLLRPTELLRAREDVAAGRISQAEFKRVEDWAVDQAVALQEQAGLDVVTDGEMRRLSFQSQLPEAVEGFGEWDIDAFLWGDWKGSPGVVEDRSTPRPRQLGVTDKLRRKRHLSAEEFTYLRRRTTRIPKITLTSPSLWANFWSPERSRGAYPTLDQPRRVSVQDDTGSLDFLTGFGLRLGASSSASEGGISRDPAPREPAAPAP